MRKLKNKRLYFNMIEIVLAIAILAFGFASVLGLFPVAIKAVRTSQAEGLANNAANNVFAYYKGYASALKSSVPLIAYFHNDLFNGNSIIDWTTTASSLRSSATADGNDFLSNLQASNNPTTDADLGFQPGMNLFQPKPTDKKPCFFLVLGSSDFKKTEFTAQIILWKEQIVKLIAGAVSSDKLTYNQAAELNVEVSWPINIPYSEREKRYYQFVIVNSDQTP